MVRRAGLVLLGTLVAFGIGEVLVRVAGLAPEVAQISIGRFRFSPDPDIGYEPVPDYEYLGEDLLYQEFRGRSNSLGFRDREHSLEPTEGGSRALVVGDSVTMGLYVDRDTDIYTSVLEAELRRASRDVELINFGVSGYNTRQEVATLIEKGLQFAPDLVIVQYSLNDTEMVNGGIIDRLREREQRSDAPDRTLAPAWLMNSELYRFVRFRLGDAGGSRARRDADLDGLGTDTVRESFERLRRAADRHGFDVLVVVFPNFERYTPELDAAHEHVAQLSAANGFRHLDLKPAFDRCFERHGRAIAVDSMHPSAIGHRCAGNAVARYLLVEGPYAVDASGGLGGGRR
jgi:lysophospholipase L1-like esterase